MALKIDRFRDKEGTLFAGFFIKNRINKNIALGASSTDAPFLFMCHKRYQNDKDLVSAVERLTGMPVERRHK